MPGPSHDLLISPAGATGTQSPDVDLALCADIGRTAAQTARAWAGNATWRGLGGFDPSGGFWLEPDDDGRLRFLRSPLCFGWLRDSEASADDPISTRFPVARPPLCAEAPATFPVLSSQIAALPGFGGCALRHRTTGLWKSVIVPADGTALAVATRAFTPLSRILSSQGLPVGRMLLVSSGGVALAWRTPGKIFGYLHLHDPSSLTRAAALVDHLLLCTARADHD